MGRPVEIGDVAVHAVDCDRVLDEVVGPDGEEIDFRRDQIGDDGGARHLDHHAGFQALVEGHAFFRKLVHALLEILLRLPYLAEAGDQREHHGELAMGTGAQDGAELLLEHARPAERNADAAPAEEGIRLRLGQRLDRQLVATGIQRADDHGMRRESFREAGVGFRLFLLARHFLAVEQQELGAVEADAFRAAVADEREFVEELDVGGKRDRPPVGGGRGGIALGLEILADLFLPVLQVAVVPQGVSGRIKDQPARIAVKNGRRERADVEHGVLDPNDGWQPQRPGENGRMGVHASELGRETEHMAAVDRGGVGGREIVGDEQVLLVRLRVARRFFGFEIPQHPLADVFEVGGPFAQVGIRHAPHRFQEMLHHRVEGKLGVLAAGRDGLGDAVEHRAVLQDHQVGFENPALFLAGDRLDPLLEFVELHLGDLERHAEALLLGIYVFGADLVDIGCRETARDHVDRADADPGRDRYALKHGFLMVVGRHPLPSSW